MGTIIALANQKGGVGKTTVCLHLAVGAARRGKRVVVVDADPQGNLTSWLLDGETRDGIFRLLINQDAPVTLVRGLREWGIGLLPGNWRTGEAMSMLAAVGRLGEIPGRLAPLRSIADFVLMDMPPSRSPGFTELLSGADDVIVPTQLERLSLEGVVLMAQTARALEAGPRLLGIVPNMARRQTNEHQAQMGSLVETFGKAVWPPVPLSVRVTEAASFGTTLFDLCPEHATTQAMRLLVERLLENGGDA